MRNRDTEARAEIAELSLQGQIARLEQRVNALERPSGDAERIPQDFGVREHLDYVTQDAAAARSPGHQYCSHADTPGSDLACEQECAAARSPEAEAYDTSIAMFNLSPRSTSRAPRRELRDACVPQNAQLLPELPLAVRRG